MVFRDICYGPRCNDGCPEELVLHEQEAKDWSTGVKIMIATFVVAIAVICLVLKVHTYRAYLTCLYLFLSTLPSPLSNLVRNVFPTSYFLKGVLLCVVEMPPLEAAKIPG